MGLSKFCTLYWKLFILLYCSVKCISASNVKLKFYGVSKHDTNLSRRYPIETPIKDYCNHNLDYSFTNLIGKTELPPLLDEEKLFCQNINNVSIKSQNESQQNMALFDTKGNAYDFYQFGPQSQSFKTNPCYHFKTRLKRQFQPLSPQFNNSNVIVNSLDSNITVTQLINITSGRSMVEIRENVVRVRINSERSNVRINPRDNFVNISVSSPFVILNASERQSLDMTSLSSEITVVTQKGGQNYSIVTESGPSNMTIRQGTALIEALADTRSRITVQGYLPNTRDQILINSQVIDQTTFTRELIMLALTQNVRTEIQLVRGLVSIIYDKVQIRVSAVDHEILIYTGVYTVRITTLLSPFSISVTDTVDVTVDNATVSVFPDTSNITGKIPYSLMQLRPDNATNVQLQTDQQSTSALSNANIDVESRNLTLEVIPSVPRIYAVSIDSYAIINTSYSNIGLTANRSVIEVLSGSPYIRVLTGNTSIEVRAGGRPFTLSPGSGTGLTFPPIGTNTISGGNNSPAGSQSTTPNSSGNSSGSSVSTLPVNSLSTISSVNGTTLQTSLSSSSTPSLNGSLTLSPTTSSNTSVLTTPPTNGSLTLTPPTNNESTVSLLTTVLSVTGQTPNISGQGEGGSSISPVDQTRVTETLLSTLSSVSTTLSSSFSPISLTGAANISETTASQSVLNSTSTLPSLFNSTLSSVSSSLSVNPASTETNLFTGSTGSIRNRTRNIFPFPFPVIIPWPLPNGQSTPSSNGSVSAVTGNSESTFSTPSSNVTISGETTISSLSIVSTTLSSVSGGSAQPGETTSGTSVPVGTGSQLTDSGSSVGTAASQSAQPGETTTSGTSVPVGTGSQLTDSGSSVGTAASQSAQPGETTTSGTAVPVSTVSQLTGSSSSGGTEGSVPTPPSFPGTGGTAQSVPTPSSLPVDLSTITSGATVSQSCITSSLNSSSDIVCIEAEIVSIQVPPMNSSSARSADTLLPTSTAAVSNGTEQFVFSQFSVGTSSNTPSVTLPLPNTAENGSVTQPVVLPEPPTFTASQPSLVSNVSSVLLNTVEVLQNTLNVLQSSTLITPTISGSASVSAQSFVLNAPPNEAYMLSVAVKVKRSTDLAAENFSKIIQNALKKAYVEGRNRQLGISTRRRIKRKSKIRKRQVGNSNVPLTKFDENSVEIRLISVDRPMSDEAKIRFYVVSDKNLVEAKRAKETFDQLGNSELSAFLTYPVTEPVQPLPVVESFISSSTQLIVATSDNRAIVAIFVTIGALLIISAVLCFILYKVKKHKPKFLTRKNSTSSGVSETGVDVNRLKRDQLKDVTIGESKTSNVDKRLLLGDLPPLPSTGPKLIKEYSDRDLSSYDNMSYSELFEYVNTSDQPVNVAHRIISPRGSKVSPLTPLSPSPVYAKWGTSHSKPPISSQVTQVVRISPGTRRRLAKNLLDSSFPLANINIEEVISSSKY